MKIILEVEVSDFVERFYQKATVITPIVTLYLDGRPFVPENVIIKPKEDKP